MGNFIEFSKDFQKLMSTEMDGVGFTLNLKVLWVFQIFFQAFPICFVNAGVKTHHSPEQKYTTCYEAIPGVAGCPGSP